MEHAEAHEWLEDLALEPRRLAGLEDDGSPDAMAFRAHLAGCGACRADLDAWRRTHEAVAGSAGPDGVAGADPLADRDALDPPSWLRDRVAAIPDRVGASSVGATASDVGARASVTHAGDHRARPRRWGRLLAAGLAAVLVVGLGAIAGGGWLVATGSQHETAELADLGASMTRILADPGRQLVTLTGLDGVPAGTAAWSSSEIVVASTALPPPPPGMEYRCWIERDGSRTPIGAMSVDDGLAYWSGPLGDYHGLRLDAGGVLGVSLEPREGPAGHAPLIAGSLQG